MSIQFKPDLETEKEYDLRARLMIRGYKEDKVDLKNNIVDLCYLDQEMAKEGEP